MRNKIMLSLLVIMLVVSLGAMGCPPRPPEPAVPAPVEEIRIGVIIPLSGPLAPIGRHLKVGAELAADMVNTKHPGIDLSIAEWEGIPNLGGAKLRLIFADSRGDPGVGAAMARRLIEDERVHVIMGAFQSSVTKTVSIEAERLGIPHVNADSTAVGLSKRDLRWFWRVTPHETWFTADLFDFLDGLVAGKSPGVPPIPKEDIDTLAMAAENTEWGKSALAEVKRFAAERGYRLVEEIVYPLRAVDLTSEAKRMVASGAEVFLFAPYVADAILWIRTLEALGATPRIIWGQDAGFVDAEFWRVLGADVNYIISRDIFSPVLGEVKPVAAQVNELFKKRTGVHFDGSTARNFVGIQVIAHALNNARSTDPEALEKALDEFYLPAEELIMPWKGVRFGSPFPGDTQQNELGSGIIIQYQGYPGGMPHIIFPFADATAKFVHPFPGWD